MARTLPILAALVLVTAAGIAHGLITHRWSTPTDLRAAAARPAQVDLKVGDWEGQTMDVDPREMTAAGVLGGVLRRYVNRRDGRAVTVLLVCGPPGPIAVHTPDICFAGIGYEVTGPLTQTSVPVPSRPRPDVFRTAILAKQSGVIPEHLRIYWSWNGAGSWTAPANPRLAFAPLPILYKLYALCPVSGPAEPAGGDAAAAFLREFLPRVDAVLSPGSAPAAGTTAGRRERPGPIPLLSLRD